MRGFFALNFSVFPRLFFCPLSIYNSMEPCTIKMAIIIKMTVCYSQHVVPFGLATPWVHRQRPPLTHVAPLTQSAFLEQCQRRLMPATLPERRKFDFRWLLFAALSGNELTRNSSGSTRLQSSQLAEPLWTDPGLKSELVCAS